MKNQVCTSIIHITAFILIIFLGYTSEVENIKKKNCTSFFTESVIPTDLNTQTETEFQQTTTVTNTNVDSNQANETDIDPDEYLYESHYYNDHYYYYDEYYYYDYNYDYYYDCDDEYPELKNFDGQVRQDNWRCHDEQTGYCFCYTLCTMYSDCCHDANITSGRGLHNQPFSCHYIPGVVDSWLVFVIDTCPVGVEHQLNGLCIEPNERNIYSILIEYRVSI